MERDRSAITIRLDADGNPIPPPEHVARMHAVELEIAERQFTDAWASARRERQITTTVFFASCVAVIAIVVAASRGWVDVRSDGMRIAVNLMIGSAGCLAVLGAIGMVAAHRHLALLQQEWVADHERLTAPVRSTDGGT